MYVHIFSFFVGIARIIKSDFFYIFLSFPLSASRYTHTCICIYIYIYMYKYIYIYIYTHTCMGM